MDKYEFMCERIYVGFVGEVSYFDRDLKFIGRVYGKVIKMIEGRDMGFAVVDTAEGRRLLIVG